MRQQPTSRIRLWFLMVGLWVVLGGLLVWRWDEILSVYEIYQKRQQENRVIQLHNQLPIVTLRESVVASQGEKMSGKSPTPNSACRGVTPVTGRPQLKLQSVATGFQALTDIAVPPGETSRIFVTEQNTGTIYILRDGKRVSQPFLQIHALISREGERGLLGLAFHPQYRVNRKFYVYITGREGEVRVMEFRTSTDPERADPQSGRTLLVIPQPEPNHNGGAIRFGLDGYLYLGIGDGGSGGDPHGPIGNGQNPKTWLGKILRIDVDRIDGSKPYAVPADNPFAKRSDILPEIVYSGLRNPWRFSFDRATGDLWVGDVGQDRAEEINFAPRGHLGLNFGWRCKEGILPFKQDVHCASKKLVDPVVHLKHDRRQPFRFCSIMVGYRYRGCKMPAYHDTVFYGDYCLNHLRSFRWDGQRASQEQQVPGTLIYTLTSWAEDAQGELLLATGQGHIYRMIPQ